MATMPLRDSQIVTFPTGKLSPSAARPSVAARADAVAAIAARHAEAVDRDGRFPAEAVEACRAHGLLGMMVPAPSAGREAVSARSWTSATASVAPAHRAG